MRLLILFWGFWSRGPMCTYGWKGVNSFFSSRVISRSLLLFMASSLYYPTTLFFFRLPALPLRSPKMIVSLESTILGIPQFSFYGNRELLLTLESSLTPYGYLVFVYCLVDFYNSFIDWFLSFYNCSWTSMATSCCFLFL